MSSTPSPSPEEKNAANQGETALEHNDVQPRKGKRFIVIGGVIAVLLVLGGGGFAAMTLMKSKAEKKEAAAKLDLIKIPQYVDLEEFLVNLSSAENRSNFLKMSVTIEVESQQDADIVKKTMPRIRDSFYIYLRELRLNDLRGSAGLYRLREELLLRLNMILYPVTVKDVLFKEIIFQ